jgi:glycosyltransferase involved in cell wall biosynthesis
VRILHLAPLYQPLNGGMEYGSIERLVLLLDEGLSAAGHRVVTVAREGSRVDGELVPVGGASGYAEQAKLALEIAAGSPFDVIQVHRREFFDLGAAAAVRQGRRHTKVVATLHGPPDRMRRFYGGYGPLASFVFVSMAQAAGVPELPGTVIHNAVDTASVPFRPVPAQPRYLSFLGRISGEKGVGEAVWLARQAGLPLKIAGVVQERDREYFESVVVPHLRVGHAKFLGPVRDAAKYELLGGSTALVLLPNYEDPCPVVALEALAAGTPVLALARGGLPELVADGVTGLIAGDLPGLLQKLPGLAGISRDTPRAVAAAQFGADRLTRDYVAVYRGTSQLFRASDR